VGILSPKMNAVFWAPDERDEGAASAGADRYAAFAPHFTSCDVVIVEGDTLASGPKFEVWRQVVGGEPLAAADGTIAAVVTDDPLPIPATVWPRSDVSAVADCILALLH
jgi:hypothetical protein